MDEGAIHYLDHLGEPFLFLEERLVELLPGERRRFMNGLPKLLFVLEGEIGHRFNQEEALCLRPGDVLVNLGREEQTYLPVEDLRPASIRVLRLTFSWEAVRDARNANAWDGDMMALIAARLPVTGVFHADGGVCGQIVEIRRELVGRSPEARQRINGLARSALVDLIRGLEVESNERGGVMDSASLLAGKVRFYLEENSHKAIRLGDVARAVNRSEEHLARVFREQRGRTIFDELQGLRIEKAKYLLLCSQMGMGAIAERCGFATLAHFSRRFRLATGTSPSEFRNKENGPA